MEFKQNYFVVWIETEDNNITEYRENNIAKQFNHPYNFNDLATVKTTQNFDVIYFTHRNYRPKTLTRTYTGNTINFIFNDVIVDTGDGTQDPFTLNGNPSCCAFYQQRLFYGGFTGQPNKIWASDIGYYSRPPP